MSRHVRRTRSPADAQRRTRLRRASALGGMLAVVGGLVVVRSNLSPAPSQALSAPGLAAAVPGAASSTPAGPTTGPSPSAPSSDSAHRRVHHHASRPAPRQVTGQAYDVGYGVVQVRVTLDGKRITDVTAVSLPRGGRSGDISGYAAPQLRREAINRQSARIDTVSGASYTSAGYARSLQSALDKSAS